MKLPVTWIAPLLFLTAHCGMPLPVTTPPSVPGLSDPPSELSTESDAPLTITILNVGQGDATLVTTPNGHRILIDGGPPGSGKQVILPYLIERGITQLSHIMASHFDSDHIGGIAEILAGRDGMADTPDDIHVSGFCWDRGNSLAKTTPAFKSYTVATAHCQRTAIAGDILQFDDGVVLEIVAINGRTRKGILTVPDDKDENASSMVVLIQHGQFRYLTTGDLPGGGGNPPYDTVDAETVLGQMLGHVDILHLGHHGSASASNLNFLKSTSPNAAIISVGDKNSYFHPNPAVLFRLSELKIPVYQTNRGHNVGTQTSHVANGNIVIESMGDGFEIRQRGK